MEPTSLPEAPEGELTGRLSGTRRNFVRGVAAAGASTAIAASLTKAGKFDLFVESAEAAEPTAFSQFSAIAASPADAFQVPEGYRADLVISYGDKFSDTRGNEYTYGYNNDFLAFFPLEGKPEEGLLFVNHEYTSPFYLHGYKPEGDGNAGYEGKSKAEIDLERSTIGNSIVHIRRNGEGVWQVVSPSAYNRRIYAGEMPDRPGHEGSRFTVTGPLAGDPKVGNEIWGSLGNCSGGTTPWGTAISCEENFDGYGLPLPSNQDFVNGWADETNDGFPGYPDYNPDAPYRSDGEPGFNKYGWVCEHDPYDPDFTPRKHTALGRFRHENTTFRHVPGKKFVLYMGDDGTNDCVYKFVSDREYLPGNRANNLQILESGQLYVARWTPEGRRRFTTAGDVEPITAESGSGTWVAVEDGWLHDTRNELETEFGGDYNTFFATNRPEDLEVGPGGDVFIAFTNNSGVDDIHGSVRKLVEEENDPTALSFVWTDYSSGGPKEDGGQGFSCPDNLTFDEEENLWVVTDISSGSLNNSSTLGYHANNAVFMVPTKGPNAGVAFRFANMPVESEGTGPYFSPDFSTLFINVQHPGEQSGVRNSPAVYGDEETYSSYWPNGNKTTGQNPSTPLPSTIAVTRIRPSAPDGGGSPVIPPPAPGGGGGGGTPGEDGTRPRVGLLSPRRQSLKRLRGDGMRFRIQVDEPVTLRVTVSGRLTSRRRRKADASARGKLRRFARRTIEVREAGVVTVRLRPSAALRLLLRRERDVPGVLSVRAVDKSGNRTTRTKTLLFK